MVDGLNDFFGGLVGRVGLAADSFSLIVLDSTKSSSSLSSLLTA